MRVAQVTYNEYRNYGNVLQKYALQKTLEKFADFTEVLWFNDKNFWVEEDEVHKMTQWDPAYRPNQVYPQNWALYEAVRATKIKEFDDRYIKTRFNLPYVEEIGDEYDFFGYRFRSSLASSKWRCHASFAEIFSVFPTQKKNCLCRQYCHARNSRRIQRILSSRDSWF